MVLVKYITILVIAALTLVSCSNEKSLQRYLVDKQSDDKFLKVDVAASLLQTDNNAMTEEQKDIFNSIKKVNVVAYPIKDGNMAEYEVEKDKIKAIVGQEKYKMLTKMKSNSTNVTLKYLGDDDAIDELIVMASDDERGFALFRLLGKDMKPGEMLKLVNSVETGDLDMKKLSGIGDIFKEMETE